MSDPPRYVVRGGWSWDNVVGFHLDKCPHRNQGACLRCRVRWLIHLWRNGNHVWYLP